MELVLVESVETIREATQEEENLIRTFAEMHNVSLDWAARELIERGEIDLLQFNEYPEQRTTEDIFIREV